MEWKSDIYIVLLLLFVTVFMVRYFTIRYDRILYWHFDLVKIAHHF
jgi:hypothetical protein